MYIEQDLIQRYRSARLPVVADAISQLTTKKGAESLSTTGVLNFIIDTVEDRKLARTVAKHRLDADLPCPFAELSDIDFRAQPNISKDDFESLMSSAWNKRKHHQVFLGEAGETKLKMASVIGNSHLNKGVRVKAVPLKKLMFDLQIALGKDKFTDALKTLNQYPMLVVYDWQIQSLRIDDIPLLTLLVEGRKSPLLIASNLSKAEWKKDLEKHPLPLSISTQLRQYSHFWQVSEPKNKSVH
ncbi:MAG: ATP-binding protein [Thalassotalea sp.]|nr:ATP-binding protein [Thalassotalea sp.]